MDKLISIYRLVDGVESMVCTISKENATLYQGIMEKDKVTLSVVTEDPVYIAEGDYILLNGIKYRINRDPEDKQSSSKEHSYDISFEAPIYTLIDKIYCNKITGSTTVTLTGKLRDFLELLIWNVNYDADSNPLGVDTGWEIGLCPDTDYMNITLETVKCRDALNTFSSKFGLEYYVVNKTINYVSHIENETGLVFTQGEGGGLYEVERKNVDDDDLVTRAYVKGGTDNVIPGEGDDQGRLMLPELYLENFSESNRVVEAEVEFSEIHPTFQGTVGTVSGDNNREFLCPEIDFDIADVAVGDEARVNFLTGDFMGKSFEFKWNNDLKKITLIYQEDDLAAIDPDTGSRPNIPSSSKYLRGGELFNFTGLKLSGTYKTNAITKLREKGTDWLAYYCRKRVKFELNVDYRYLRKNNTELHCGDLITINVPLHNISKLIRVTAIERNLYTGKLTCTVSNYLDEKWKDKIENQIAEIKTSTSSVNGGYGGATSVTIIEKNDEREPSDSNIFSSLRTLKEIAERSLSKKKADTAAEIIDFLKGWTVGDKASIDKDGNATVQQLIALVKAQIAALEVTGNAKTNSLDVTETAKAKDVEVSNSVTTLNAVIQALAKTHDLTVENTADIMNGIIRQYLTSESFVSGFLGSGFKIWQDEQGLWHGELDELTVRKTFLVFELVVQKIVHQGGMVIRSAAGGKLKKVTDGGTYWKCEHDSTDDFVVGDQVLCQTFTGTSMKRYWRLVTSAGASYFNLSKSDCETGSANPEAGDEVAVLGNRTVAARQKAQIDCAVGDDAPYRDDYSGINSYSLVGKLINRTGNLSGITDPDFGALSGSGLYGINVYLKGIFRLLSGKTVETAISDAQAESNAYTDGKITKIETSFEIREGQISSKVTEATTAATNADSSATLAQGYASTATSKASAASNSASSAAGSATTAGQKASAAAGSAADAKSAVDNASDILSQVTTKESSINQTAGNITLQVQEVTTKVTTATNAANTATSKASEASTSAGTASTKASAAATSATNAKTSETNASGSASTASSKASAADNSAKAAADSATAATTSAAAAADVLTEVIEKKSSIEQTAGNITLQVTEVTKKTTQAATSATNAASSAGSAASSASTASTKASAAATSADTASTKASAASGSASAAATSATNASNSASSAASSASAATNVLTTVTSKQSEINQTASNITLQVTEVTKKTTQAATSATNAASSAGSAASSASTASTKASAAATSADTASTKASAASGSASAAATSATNASNSASSAASSASAATNVLTTVTSKQSEINQTASNITLQVTEVTTKTSQATNAADLATAMSKGKMLYRDPIFASGLNSITVYNNTGNGLVTHARVSGVSGNPNGSGYCLIITTTGSANPGWGGFTFQTQTKANRVLVIRFVATIPSGRTVEFGSNSIGDGSSRKWLTDNTGTGKWEEYAFKVVCGSSGSFSTTNFFYLSGGSTPTASTPLIWYVCYATVFDVTDVDDVPTRAEASNDAESKANAAQSAAISAASTDATTKANTAQNNAISAAATDATSKANTAESNAKGYANNTFTTKTEFSSQLTILNNSISTKVSQTDFNSLGSRVGSAETTISQHTNLIALKASQSDLTALGSRVTSAEAKITSDAINLTVKSQIENIAKTAVDGVQVGGRNLLRDSAKELHNAGTNGEFLWISDVFSIYDAHGIGTYTFSFDAKADIIGLMRFYSTPGTTSDFKYVFDSRYFQISTEYKRYSFTVEVRSSNPSSASSPICLYGEYGSGRKPWIKNIKVELGNKATDWTPAPEDVDASIALRPTTNEIKSQFTIDQTGISMLGKKISLTGLITFSSLDSSTQSTINSKATTGYVDGAKSSAISTAATDATTKVNASQTALATQLGYSSYAEMTAQAAAGKTIINGGYINTLLIKAKAITSELIDVANLTVKNVEAKDSNGNVTCKINGATGDVKIKGDLTVQSLRLSLIPDNGSLKDGYLMLSSSGSYIAPELSDNEVMEVRFITPAWSRMVVSITLIPKNSNVRIGTTVWLLSAVNSNVTISGIGSILGFKRDGITYWIISYNEKD